MLVLCRCAQGPAPSGDQGRHYASAWWEPGGFTDTPLFPERCHSSCERKPDDSNQPGRVLSAFPLPPQHAEEREFFPKVLVRGDMPVLGSLLQAEAASHSFRVVGFVLESSKRELDLLPSQLTCLSCPPPSFLLSPGGVTSWKSSQDQVWEERLGFELRHGRCLLQCSPVSSVTLSWCLLPAKNMHLPT